MSDAIHASLREHITAFLETEADDLETEADELRDELRGAR